MKTSRPRVLLAEDHPSTTLLLQELLSDDFDVVGAVKDGKALIRACAVLAPDVVPLAKVQPSEVLS